MHGTLTPIDWLAEVLMKQDEADQQKIFVMRNPETLTALQLSPEAGKYFSFRQFVPHLQEIEQQAALAQKVDAQLRSPFQRDIIKLFERLTLYHRLENSLEVTGTKNFKGQVEDLVKNIRPVPIPMQQRHHGRRFAEPRLSRRDRILFPDPALSP